MAWPLSGRMSVTNEDVPSGSKNPRDSRSAERLLGAKMWLYATIFPLTLCQNSRIHLIY
jgi:hypothetical protein